MDGFSLMQYHNQNRDKMKKLNLRNTKVLLILPPEPSLQRRIYLPEGMGRIAAYLKSRGLCVSQISLDAKYASGNLGLEPGNLLDCLEFDKVDIIAFSIISHSQLDIATTMAQEIKNRKNISIIMGGPVFYGISPDGCMQKNGHTVDYIITGEGEEPMFELMKYLRGDKNVKLTNIAGLAYREGTKFIENKRGAIDINSLPLPDYDDVIEDYSKIRSHTVMIPYQVSRGCKGSCLFCNFKGGYSIALKSPKIIVRDIKRLAKKYKIHDFYLSCNAINIDNAHLVSLCREFIKAGEPIRWHCYARPEGLDLRLLRLMKQAGCLEIRYGLESASPKIIDYLGKGFSLQEAEQIIRDTKKAGISVGIELMFDVPAEKKGDILDTAGFIKRNRESIDWVLVHRFAMSYNSSFYLKKGFLYRQRHFFNALLNRSYNKKLFEAIKNNNIPLVTGYFSRDYVNKLLNTWWLP